MKKDEKIPLDALKGRMREWRYTYRQLAKEMNCSSTTLSNKLNGIAYFDGKEIEKTCRILGIPAEDISKYFFPRLLLYSNKNTA